jgi:hypothetical protein
VANIQDSDGPKPSKANTGPIFITGCTLLVVAMSSSGLLQWLLYAGAIGSFLYAAIMSVKAAKRNKS